MANTWLLFAFCIFLYHEGIFALDPVIIDDLTTPNRIIGLKTINHFMNLVNKKMPQFQMIPLTDEIIQCYYPGKNNGAIHGNYGNFDTDKNDVQILSNHIIGDKVPNYVVAEYSGKTKFIRILDSWERFRLTHVANTVLQQRYHYSPKYYFQYPYTRNVEKSSSGVMAIAYVTLLIHGEDARLYPLLMDKSSTDPTMSLRRHILEMFNSGNLTIFPKANFDEVLSSQIVKELSSANEPFSDVTVNYFIDIMRNTRNFDMINLSHSTVAYKKINNSNNMDVQILYGGNSTNPNDSFDSTYYICIFYTGQNSKSVIVYDVTLEKLSPRNLKIIKQRYPNYKGIYYAKPNKEQKEKSKHEMNHTKMGGLMRKVKFNKDKARISSGAMAIAFAETLISRSDNMDNLILDKILLEEAIGDQNDLRKNILALFRTKKSFYSIGCHYISNRPHKNADGGSCGFDGGCGVIPLELFLICFL